MNIDPAQAARTERRALIKLALPLVGGQLAAMSMNVVDTLIAGKHSPHTLAVVGLGSAMWSIVIIVGLGLMLAVTPTVSQLDGAKRREEIAPMMTQAVWLAIVVGVALMLGLLQENGCCAGWTCRRNCAGHREVP
ncbi:MAG: hypothetical protein IPK97_06255 [Ahniella sp.]|nr:hypothetical protein [Ahniella sp.]